MKRYIIYLFGTTLCALVIAATLSYFVDPGGVYHHDKGVVAAYPERLLSAVNGLSVPEGAVDEREAARALAPFASRFSCIVIGSSHVMQISSVRLARSLATECPDLLNLGVSGAGIEDHLILVHQILSGKSAQKIVLGMDPWVFMYGRDSGHRIDYLRARHDILGDKQALAVGDEPGKLANLLNGQYVWRSMNMLLQHGGIDSISESLPVDPEVGGEHAVRLRDGSLVYSASYIRDSMKVPSGCGPSYHTDHYQVQPWATEDYRRLIRWIKAHGAEPVFLMTPYHIGVFDCPNSPNMRAIQATAAVITRLAKEEQVRALGSYDPRTIGCQPDEFYDFMHPKASCLAKIEG